MLNDRELFIRAFQELQDEHSTTFKAKNSDYTGDSFDPFFNLTMVEKMGIATTEQGFLCRMMDKMSRISSLTKPGSEAKVKSESVEDTLNDLAVYAMLFVLYLRGKRLGSVG